MHDHPGTATFGVENKPSRTQTKPGLFIEAIEFRYLDISAYVRRQTKLNGAMGGVRDDDGNTLIGAA